MGGQRSGLNGRLQGDCGALRTGCMHDGEVTEALGTEIESMALFNEWMLANMKISDRSDHVREAVHQVTQAHRRVIEAHRMWTKDGSNKGAVIAACVAFRDLVSTFIH